MNPCRGGILMLQMYVLILICAKKLFEFMKKFYLYCEPYKFKQLQDIVKNINNTSLVVPIWWLQ